MTISGSDRGSIFGIELILDLFGITMGQDLQEF
jgi:hypothetical protein